MKEIEIVSARIQTPGGLMDEACRLSIVVDYYLSYKVIKRGTASLWLERYLLKMSSRTRGRTQGKIQWHYRMA